MPRIMYFDDTPTLGQELIRNRDDSGTELEPYGLSMKLSDMGIDGTRMCDNVIYLTNLVKKVALKKLSQTCLNNFD